MDVTERQKMILSIIQERRQITGQDLSRILGVSLRTIRNEVKAINAQERLIDSSNSGYSLNTENDQIEVSYKSSDEINNILVSIIFNDEHKDIDTIAEQLLLSKSSLERRLRAVEAVLEKFHLWLSRKKNTLAVEGEETEIRNLIHFLLTREVHDEFTLTINYENFLKGIDVNRIQQMLLHTFEKYGVQWKDCTPFNPYINIYITLYRSRLGAHITKPISANETDKEYAMAKEIYQQYANHWNFQADRNDICYLAILLSQQIGDYDLDEQKKAVRWRRFLDEIQEIVKETFTYYKITIAYKDFIEDFALHVDALIQRARISQYVYNDLVDNLKKNCPFIYDVSAMLAKKISERYHIYIPEEEIGFITVHIGFLIEKTDTEKVSILLMTSSYHHISHLIREQLIQRYKSTVQIIDQISEKKIDTIDLIITNKPVQIISKNIVVISPFFTLDDQDKIDEAIKKCLKRKEISFQEITLNTFFKEDLFFKSDHYQTKDQVIRFLFEKLKSKDIVDDNYYDSVIQREELSSTCFFDLFAVPHSFEFLAKKTRFAILISEKGILWDNKKIHLVFMIAIRYNDRKIFMRMYNYLVKALQTQVNAVIRANNVYEFIEIIKQQQI